MEEFSSVANRVVNNLTKIIQKEKKMRPMEKLSPQAQVRRLEHLEKKKTIKRETINNTELLANSGARILHIRPDGYTTHNGLTIAFREKNRNVVEVATAICHTNDTFCKKAGAKLALESFIKGKTILVPNGRLVGGTVIDVLKGRFG